MKTYIAAISTLNAHAYNAYLFWFLQIMSINAGREFAHERIRSRLRQFNWPL